MALRALSAKPSITARMSSASIALVVKWLDGSGICVGAHMICGGCSSEVWPPCVSWLKILRAMRVHRIGHLARDRESTAGSQALMKRRDILPVGWIGLALDDDQRDAAARALRVIGGEVVRRHAVEIAERGEVRLEDHAVAQLDRADANALIRCANGFEAPVCD